jgi:hypothetical protein
VPYKRKLNRRMVLKDGYPEYLTDRLDFSDGGLKSMDLFNLQGSTSEQHELWDAYGGEVVLQWIQERPGTRPSLWWEYTAPKQPKRDKDGYFSGRLPEPRLLIDSTGEDDHFHYYYFKGVEVYSIDPNVFIESEPAYLRRHNLMSDEEIRRLTAADYEPVRASDILEERKIRRSY